MKLEGKCMDIRHKFRQVRAAGIAQYNTSYMVVGILRLVLGCGSLLSHLAIGNMP